MPYPNEHSCRLEDPEKYEKFSRKNCGEKHEEKCIDVIYGIREGKSEIQALRYQKEIWTAAAARSHCRSRKGSFEAAGEEKGLEGEIETRMFESMEVREEKDKDIPVIVGYAAVFDKLSVDLGGFREKIRVGAFAESLKEIEEGKRVVNSFFNHDRNFLLATTANGSLRLREDEKGLYAEIEPIITVLNGHPINLIRAKAVRGMSFAWSVRGLEESWDYKDKNDIIRTLVKIPLLDASPVVEPAYPQTSVKVRDYINAINEVEVKPDPLGLSPKEGAEVGQARQRLNYGFPKK